MKLNDLVGIVLEASVDASDNMQEQYHNRFLDLFEDPDGDGVYTPRIVKIQFGHLLFEVPVIVLRLLNPMKTNKLTYELDTDMNLSGHEDAEGNPALEISMHKGLFKNASHMKITAELESVEISEGFARLVDEFNDKVSKALEQMGAIKVTDLSKEGATN